MTGIGIWKRYEACEGCGARRRIACDVARRPSKATPCAGRQEIPPHIRRPPPSTIERQHARLLELNDEMAALKEKLAKEKETTAALKLDIGTLAKDLKETRSSCNAWMAACERADRRENILQTRLDRADKRIAEIHALTK